MNRERLLNAVRTVSPIVSSPQFRLTAPNLDEHTKGDAFVLRTANGLSKFGVFVAGTIEAITHVTDNANQEYNHLHFLKAVSALLICGLVTGMYARIARRKFIHKHGGASVKNDPLFGGFKEP